MSDKYDQRAAQAEDARNELKDAGAAIARAWSVEGLCDPAYMANVLEAEAVRMDKPGSEIIERKWSGRDAFGHSVKDLLQATDIDFPAGMTPAQQAGARAGAIRLARSYSHKFGDPHVIADMTRIVAEHLSRTTYGSRVRDVEDALRTIQKHRRLTGLQPLDAHAAGWTEEDVVLEAERLKREGRVRNPELEQLKRRLMR